MCQLWKNQVLSHIPEGPTILVNTWIVRAALDIIGEGIVALYIVVCGDVDFLADFLDKPPLNSTLVHWVTRITN